MVTTSLASVDQISENDATKLKLVIEALIIAIYDEWPQDTLLVDIVESSSNSTENIEAVEWLMRSPYYPSFREVNGHILGKGS